MTARLKSSPATLLGAAVLFVFSVTSLRSQTLLVDFNFEGNDGTQLSETPTVTAGLTATDLTRGAGMRATGAVSQSANGFGIRKPSGATTTSADTLTEAFAQNIYAYFSVTVDPGQTASFSSLDFGWARQNNKNRSLALLVRVGDTNFSESDLVATISSTTLAGGATPTTHSFSLSGTPSLQSIAGSSTVYFRVYLFGTQDQYESEALSDTGTAVGLDLMGTVIPEPASAALLLGLAGGFIAFTRRPARRLHGA